MSRNDQEITTLKTLGDKRPMSLVLSGTRDKWSTGSIEKNGFICLKQLQCVVKLVSLSLTIPAGLGSVRRVCSTGGLLFSRHKPSVKPAPFNSARMIIPAGFFFQEML